MEVVKIPPTCTFPDINNGNKLIWNKAGGGGRTADCKLQKVQNCITKSTVHFLHLAEKITECSQGKAVPDNKEF